MGIFQKLSKAFSKSSQAPDEGIWVYVVCAECGEKIRTRIDPPVDLTPVYGDGGATGCYV